MQPSTILTALAWLVGLSLAYLWFDAYLEDRYHPNRGLEVTANGPGPVRIVLQRNANDAYLLPGEINGRAVTFIIDTGATAVAVPERLGAQLGMPRGPRVEIGTANGPAWARLSHIEVLAIGPLRLHDVTAYLAPGLSGDEVLLGMSALRRLDFRQQGDRLVLEYTGNGSP